MPGVTSSVTPHPQVNLTALGALWAELQDEIHEVCIRVRPKMKVYEVHHLQIRMWEQLVAAWKEGCDADGIVWSASGPLMVLEASIPSRRRRQQ